MVFDIITIFPDMLKAYLDYGIISRAIKEHLISVNVINLRDFAINKRGQVDDAIFGYGCGMLFRPEPLFGAIQAIKEKEPESHFVFLTPQGKRFNNKEAKRLSRYKSITLICARYEGIDARIVQGFVDEEISIGDYILTGGEIPALVIVDAVSRFLENLIKKNSAEDESFENGLLEHEHYTEPVVFMGRKVPEVLRSGNHKAIERFRFISSLKKTYFNRIDLFREYMFSFGAGATGNYIRALKRKNEKMQELIKEIQNISKEWKNARRSSDNQ